LKAVMLNKWGYSTTVIVRCDKRIKANSRFYLGYL